ncbi:MAG: ABC transporter ATP-binding protein [Omnitrophica bacterium RIFCSPHIGHO2_02_FULL_46_11]|nr:MAG: ABC transporter ATP-binding protein [Omnitrophica bacterium RIFCSPLOWO2_01_FULL_45_10b]OGW87720.1 MAG: ABC transporter ATP-binding protein [Omnitrophica bacterium RIFCSPHIGHO2_02_FULL_46_11]
MIEIIDLHKSFGAHRVLDGVNLKIETGETMVIIGRSGTGKSVLLKHIIGIMKPDSGEILVDGVNIFEIPGDEINQFRMQIGMLFQGSALFDSLTVRENIGFSLYEHTQLAHDEIDRRVKERLRLVGLSGIEDLMPSELSGGMKKRVGLARAICTEPKIILYDEPTTGLDPIMADAINDLILRMQQRLRITSIVVTHDMTSAYKVGTRIAMLYGGKIVGVGTPAEIRNSKDPLIQQFITGSAHGPITAEEGSSTYLLGNGNGDNNQAQGETA